MDPRPLGTSEHVTHTCEELFTLNFVTVARVRGVVGRERVSAALVELARKHPLLSAAIRPERGRPWFFPGEAAKLTLSEVEGPQDSWREQAEALMQHVPWQGDGPRARLVWLRHGPDHATFLLLLHHVVSDGSSGVIAMRDLLRFLSGESLGEPLVARAQHDFYPAAMRARPRPLRAFAFLLREFSKSPPARISAPVKALLHERRTGIVSVDFDASRLRDKARAHGATVHGVLNAAALLALRPRLSPRTRVSVMHPVDMRRYIAALAHTHDDALPISDAVGCYVSYVQTGHRLDKHVDLPSLAREVTETIRTKKASGEPFLTQPFMAGLLPLMVRALSKDRARDLCEQLLSANTFALTNLGPLEALGVQERFGDLIVEDFFFMASSSVNAQIGGAASSFNNRLRFVTAFVQPFVSPEVATAVTNETAELLR